MKCTTLLMSRMSLSLPNTGMLSSGTEVINAAGFLYSRPPVFTHLGLMKIASGIIQDLCSYEESAYLKSTAVGVIEALTLSGKWVVITVLPGPISS